MDERQLFGKSTRLLRNRGHDEAALLVRELPWQSLAKSVTLCGCAGGVDNSLEHEVDVGLRHEDVELGMIDVVQPAEEVGIFADAFTRKKLKPSMPSFGSISSTSSRTLSRT
jgi:hypothetical protein